MALDRLGCREHTVELLDAGGTPIGLLDGISSLRWERRRRVTSLATVVLEATADCCRFLDSVPTWRTRMLIRRDGDPVWLGPLMEPLFGPSTTTLTARDQSAWLYRRIIADDLSFTDRDIVEIASAVISSGLLRHDPGIQVDSIGSDIAIDLEIEGGTRTVGEVLDDLAGLGLSWTAIMSGIVLSGPGCTGGIPELSSANFPDGATVVESGTDLINEVVVIGATLPDGTEIRAEHASTTTLDYYGPVGRIVRDSTITTVAAAEELARQLVNAGQVAPLYLATTEGTRLGPETLVDIDHLQPGVCVGVRHDEGCLPVSERLQIDSIVVTETVGEGDVVLATFASESASLSKTLI